ncbi:MAG: glycosyltransferase family 39 protein [Acidobacteriota bacterium]|nr:glycosyltransferase family 39 protein [Acidobacteriota bacterium]
MARRLRPFLTSVFPILIAAALLRLWFAWDYERHAPHQALRAIPFLFESGNIAVSIAKGGGFASPFRVNTGPTAWMTPLYPLLLSVILRVFGVYTYKAWAAAVLMNICFSTLACLPVYYAAKRMGGTGLAALAAWLWAIFPNAILLSFQSLWDTSLSALLGITVVWATLRVADSRRSIEWWAYGLLWGTALMANAALLSLLPILLGWAWWRNRSLNRAALALLMTVACCIPWTIRNYRVFHTLVPLRSVLGLQLWVGNNPDAKVVWLGTQHPIHDVAEREHYTEIGEIAYMREKRDNAIRYILTHPSHEAELIAGRFVMVWSGGTPSPLADFASSHSAWFRFVLLFNLAAALAAATGIVVLFLRRNPCAIPFAAGPVIFPFAYYLTLALPRYRHPIDPTLMILLAYCLRSLVALNYSPNS